MKEENMNRLKQVVTLLLVLAMAGQICLTSYAASVPEGLKEGQVLEEQQEKEKQEEEKQEELPGEEPKEELPGEEQKEETAAEKDGEEASETGTEMKMEQMLQVSALSMDEEEPEKMTPDDSEQPRNWNYSKSKTATNLDSNFESKVTLSLPSAEEQLVSDVVFVLDKSTSPSIEKQITDMLQALKDQMKDTDAVIRVGVVIFNKQANCVLDLTELNDANMPAIKEAIETKISSGTNLHAGLLAGKAMLDGDDEVSTGRKYLAVVSDGITYMFNESPTAVAWSVMNDNSVINWCGPDNWKSKYENNNPSENWGDWMDTIEEQIDADGTTYDYPYKGTPEISTPPSAAAIHANSIDKALYLSASVYQDAVDAGYHCFSVGAETTSEEDMVYKWGPSFMEYLSKLSGTTGYDFSEIQNDILYFLDAGSYVEDYMGYVEGDYNFDLVNDASALSMKVGDEILLAELIEENHYGFGKDANGSYRYELTYEPGDKQGTEHFTWLTHVPVKNSERVQLTYTVKLMNPKTADGTYGSYDADGSKGYAGLYTNNSAVLYPKDSDGKEGASEAFAKPTVSYTVATAKPSEPSNSSGHHSTPKTLETPKTGDSSLEGFWGILACAAVLCLISAVMFKRKRVK